MRRLLKSPLLALAAGLLLRLIYVLAYATDGGDSALYENLGSNWVQHGVYGIFLKGTLVPVDLRTPGYPSFLALVYLLCGKAGVAARPWVMMAQAGVDMLTCVLIAGLALLIFSEASGKSEDREKLKMRALWLAATCPFIGNYAAVILSEILATFWTACGLLFFALQMRSAGGMLTLFVPAQWRWGRFAERNLPELAGFLGGVAVGCGTLVRPETPLLLVSSAVALAVVMFRRGEKARWLRAAFLMGLGCLLPLVPWAARNAVTLHKVQLLNPRYNELPGEFVSRGFMKWENTWLDRYRYSYLVTFKLEHEPIVLEDIPAQAFDTAEEKETVFRLLGEYNRTGKYGPEADAVFGELARERTARHPLRTWVTIPLTRAVVLWFTPQMELLPYHSDIFPLEVEWDENGQDLMITLGLFLLNIIYILLAWRGARRLWSKGAGARPALLLFAAFLLLRTAFLTTAESPDPRYVIVCYPVLLALAAHALGRSEETEPDAIAVPAVLRTA
jgi:hypothetical protein